MANKLQNVLKRMAQTLNYIVIYYQQIYNKENHWSYYT